MSSRQDLSAAREGLLARCRAYISMDIGNFGPDGKVMMSMIMCRAACNGSRSIPMGQAKPAHRSHDALTLRVKQDQCGQRELPTRPKSIRTTDWLDWISALGRTKLGIRWCVCRSVIYPWRHPAVSLPATTFPQHRRDVSQPGRSILDLPLAHRGSAPVAKKRFRWCGPWHERQRS